MDEGCDTEVHPLAFFKKTLQQGLVKLVSFQGWFSNLEPSCLSLPECWDYRYRYHCTFFFCKPCRGSECAFRVEKAYWRWSVCSTPPLTPTLHLASVTPHRPCPPLSITSLTWGLSILEPCLPFCTAPVFIFADLFLVSLYPWQTPELLFSMLPGSFSLAQTPVWPLASNLPSGFVCSSTQKQILHLSQWGLEPYSTNNL